MVGILSVSARVRTYLSINYLIYGACMARKAGEKERTGWTTREQREEAEAFATSAIIMSAAAVEAFINELCADCRDEGAKNSHGIPPAKAELVGRVWSDVPKTEREGVLEKYEIVLRLAELPRLDRKADAYQAVQNLLNLRNKLMHYKLSSQEFGVSHPDQKLDDLEMRLRKSFPDNRQTPAGVPYFPYGLLGYGAAAWSVDTAVAFLDYFCGALSIRAPYELSRPKLATNIAA
ncbi:hypothetical protein [Achromobacter marplatensis]|uniref:hypothetical protein n=1 Tax=Achromobacter marplatensis TaxID=470868 RepID=UPI0028ED624D|nr:hypothetical protein [Achromobacter marplatensis]